MTETKKLDEINIRDPFVLAYNDTYYMYGTRAETCWGLANGFDVYTSTDLENWKGPIEIFHKPDDFWADMNYWAPEVYRYKNAFYMFASFNSKAKNKKGTMILKAESPTGPFHIHSNGKITPDAWNCLDGTLYLSPDQKPYMIFSHEWTDIGDGQICSIALSADLTHSVGDPEILFSASQGTPWVKSITNKQWNGPIYVTDGPFMHRLPDGKLIMLWASFGDNGYVEAIAESDNGDINGTWKIREKPLFSDNGGHGMLFRTFSGVQKLALHQPNTSLQEHPVFIDIPESYF